MPKVTAEDLRKAYKKERDPRVKIRMAAVNMVCMNNQSIQHTADWLMQCPNWVSFWVKRFEEGGIDALRDLPRTGRKPRVPRKTMEDIIKTASESRTTPAMLQQIIRRSTGTGFHITYVRKLMHKYGLTPKVPQLVHVNHATDSAVRSWQYRLKERISRLKSEGFTIVATDESFFTHDPKSGRKYWSPINERMLLPYTGGHKKVVVYRAVTNHGRQLFRTHEKFDGPTFLAYVKELHHRWGKIAILCDRASPHRTHALKKFAKSCGDIVVLHTPKGSPYLNPVEACWKEGRRVLLMSEYYETFATMCTAVSRYYRTVRFRLDVFTYLYRSPSRFLMNL